MTNFTDLGLDTRLLKALETEGYVTPTPIQAQAIPAVMKGADLLGIAQTGTGKTAAFALPILHRLAADRRPAPRRGCRVLVLSPTRELASQIADSFRTYGRNLGVTVAVIFGGVGYRPQIQSVSRGVDILVATPGRLLDHVGERNVDLSGTEIFVLDEADQMLDLGFLQPIRKVVAQFANRRQNLFFSATMPGEIGKLAGELLHNPTKVSVAPAATTAERVSQRVIHVERHKKRAVLVELLSNADLKRTLVFTRTKRGADKVAEHLEANDIRVAAIHGNKSQGQRERALDQFRRSQIRVLVATDIAARGIDIDQVSHVINFELPEVPEAYVHRIGRTARAGEAGIAISLCDPDERDQLRDIERLTRQSLPHENRITGEVVPLDATGVPRGRPTGRSNAHRGGSGSGQGDRNGNHTRDRDARPRADRDSRSRGDRVAHGRSNGHRSDRGERQVEDARSASDTVARAPYRPERTGDHDTRNGEGRRRDGASDRGARNGDRGPRSDFASRSDHSSGSRRDRQDRGDRKRHASGHTARADHAPRDDRNSAPRGDRQDHGERNSQGDRRASDRRDGDRKPHGARADNASRGDQHERKGEHRPGFESRGDGAPRGDRGERRTADGKPRNFVPRREGGGEKRGHAGKPGGFQGLKRKSDDKPVWSNRP